MKVLIAIVLACATCAPALAQSWGRGGAYTGAGSGQVVRSGQEYYPRTRVHGCTWSIAASCAAWRNGSYSRDGVTHQLVKRFPNGRWTVHVFHGNVRVK
jgi:hypothetical protein